MATKNLSRTIIEGGRSNGNKNSRRRSNQEQRAKTKQFVGAVTKLIDPDDAKIEPKRKKVGKDFADKLSPIYRWIDSRVGQKWDKVYSELKTTFDTRTTAGAHVINDHLLREVHRKPEAEMRGLKSLSKDGLVNPIRERWYVDDHGALCRGRGLRRSYSPKNKAKRQPTEQWADGRRVIIKKGVGYWAVPDKQVWRICSTQNMSKPRYNTCKKQHRKVTMLEQVKTVFGIDKVKLVAVKDILGFTNYYRQIDKYECQTSSGAFRGGPKLTDAEMAYWNKLSEREQLGLLWHLTSKQHKRLNNLKYGGVY